MAHHLNRRAVLAGMSGAVSTPLTAKIGSGLKSTNSSGTGCPYPSTTETYTEQDYEEKWVGSDDFEIGCCPGGGSSDGRILEIIHSLYYEFTHYTETLGWHHRFFAAGNAQSISVDYYGNKTASNSIDQVTFGVENMSQSTASIFPDIENAAAYPEPSDGNPESGYQEYIEFAYTAAKAIVSYNNPKIGVVITAAEFADALKNEYSQENDSSSTWETTWNWNSHPCQASHFNTFMMQSKEGEHTTSFQAYSRASDAAVAMEDVEYKDYYHIDPLDCDPNDPICPTTSEASEHDEDLYLKQLEASPKVVEVFPSNPVYQKIIIYHEMSSASRVADIPGNPRIFLAISPNIRTGREALAYMRDSA